MADNALLDRDRLRGILTRWGPLGGIIDAGNLAVTGAREAGASFNRLLSYRPGNLAELPHEEATGSVRHPDTNPDVDVPLESGSLALNVGLAAAPTALAGGVSRNALTTFIGPTGARSMAAAGRPTAQHVLHGAEKLERQGVPVEQIQDAARRMIEAQDPQLGLLERGRDGRWRIEIDDSGMRYSDPGQGLHPLRTAVEHPELRLAYPDIGEIAFNRSNNIAGAGHRAGIPQVGLESEVILGRTLEPRKSLMHELQHEAQLREGFARGGSPEEFSTGSRSVTSSDDPAYQQYRRLAGEVEAERTANRIDLTPAERRNTPLRGTEPRIPDEEQIVRFSRLHQLSEHRPPKLTPQQIAEAAAQRRAGTPIDELASALGVSPDTLKRNFRSYENMGDVYRQERSASLRANRQPGQPKTQWTEERERRLVELVRDRVPQPHIAEELGITIHQLEGFLRRHRDRLGLDRYHYDSAYRPERRPEPRPEPRPDASLQPREPLVRRRKPEDSRDRAALGVENGALRLEQQMRSQGATDDAIANAINQRFGGNATAADIASGNVWWRVSEAPTTETLAGGGRNRVSLEDWMTP